MKALFTLIAALLLSACATTADAPDSLDRIAQDYVKLQLAIGEKEEGYIDAFYGPAEWREQARAQAGATTLPQLRARVAALSARIAAVRFA
jgi:uncharacterized protein YceH (UPF0502 family)